MFSSFLSKMSDSYSTADPSKDYKPINNLGKCDGKVKQRSIHGQVECVMNSESRQQQLSCSLSISSKRRPRYLKGDIVNATENVAAATEEEEECIRTEDLSMAVGQFCTVTDTTAAAASVGGDLEGQQTTAAASSSSGSSNDIHCTLRLLSHSNAASESGLSHRNVLPPLPIMMDPIDRSSSSSKFRSGSGGINDDRLFPQYPLYCEGMPKPRMRGVVHLLYALLLPLLLLHLWREANGSTAGRVAGVVFAASNFYCVALSALFHLGSWSAKTEIFIQKLDHSAISVYATGVNFPSSLLLLPAPWGVLLLLLSAASTAWTAWHIFNGRPAVWRHAVTSAMIICFAPALLQYMSPLEFSCGALNALIQGAGALVFVRQRPDPCPSVCGYHEIFHCIVVLGMTVTYICNWSIIRRTCNPYAIDADIMHLPWWEHWFH